MQRNDKAVIVIAKDNGLIPPPEVPLVTATKKRKPKECKTVTHMENASCSTQNPLTACPVSVILEKAQINESLHAKYAKSLDNIYEEMSSEVFIFKFLKGIRVFLKIEETNPFANVGLKFCAKYLASLSNNDLHPILVSTFEFLLNTISLDARIRFRLCEFVNLLLSFMGPEAALDTSICNNIVTYMLDRLTDASPAVRVQAIRALQRLQLPYKDEIIRTYLFHLANDPSAAVRVAVVTVIARNAETIPAILDRLGDIDENVRRQTCLQLCSYPVKSLTVIQRVIFLEESLNDKSERVRKMVTTVLLPQWFTSYQRKYIALVSALKLDANETEIKRFIIIAKQVLFAIFKTESIDKLIEALPLITEGVECEKCVPIGKLTVEIAVYWLAFIEYFQSDAADDDDRLQNCICELNTFCDYLIKFFDDIDIIDVDDDENDEWLAQENRYKAIILFDVVISLDFSDETGRQKLKTFIAKILATRALDHGIIQKLVVCVEKLIEPNECLQFFVDIVRMYIDPLEGTIDFSKKSIRLLNNTKDPESYAIMQLRLKILDLKEQVTLTKQQKDLTQLHEISEKLSAQRDELLYLINDNESVNDQLSLATNKMTKESILQCLQICFYSIASKQTKKLTQSMYQLYQDFIRIQTESEQLIVRNWALKCDIAFSLKYEKLAKDAYMRLTAQFYKHHNKYIWPTSIKGAIELIDKYGFEYFDKDGDDDECVVDIMHVFQNILDKCEGRIIKTALITGFCRLQLSGRYESENIVAKLLLIFFNSDTDSEINQILAIFFRTLVARKQQKCLADALLPALRIIFESPNENEMHEINAAQIVQFVVTATMPADRTASANIHNILARKFLHAMNEHFRNKDLQKLLSKELLILDVSSNDLSLRAALLRESDEFLTHNIEKRTASNIEKFREMLAKMSTIPGSSGAMDQHKDGSDFGMLDGNGNRIH